MNYLEVVKVDTEDVSLTPLAIKYLQKVQNALLSVNDGAWKLAKAIHDTVEAKDFKEAFGSMENYGAHIGMDKSAISRLSRAVPLYNKLQSSDITKNHILTPTQVCEMIPAAGKDDIVEWYIANNISPDMSCKDIRKIVKTYLQLQSGEEPEDTNSTEDAGENENGGGHDTDTHDTKVLKTELPFNMPVDIVIAGTKYIVDDIVIAAQILEMLENYVA